MMILKLVLIVMPLLKLELMMQMCLSTFELKDKLRFTIDFQSMYWQTCYQLIMCICSYIHHYFAVLLFNI